MSNVLKIDADYSLLPNTFDIFIGERIKDLREKRDIAPNKFAKLLRVDENILKEYEAGSRRMPATLIVQGSQQLCVSLSTIFSDKIPMLNPLSHVLGLNDRVR